MKMNRIPDNWLEEALRYYGCIVCHALSRTEFNMLVSDLTQTGLGDFLTSKHRERIASAVDMNEFQFGIAIHKGSRRQ